MRIVMNGPSAVGRLFRRVARRRRGPRFIARGAHGETIRRGAQKRLDE
jgi:hypothetical protein